MPIKLEDLKTAGCYKLKRATFIVLQIEDIGMLNFPIYHLYFIRHYEGIAIASAQYTPHTLTDMLKKWS